MQSLTNVTFDEIHVGDTANVSRELSGFEVEALALVGGDVDAFHVPALRACGAHAKEKLRNTQLECQAYAYEHGIDRPEMDGWTWPGKP